MPRTRCRSRVVAAPSRGVSIYLSGLLWILGVAALAAVIAVLIHRMTSGKDRSDNNSVAGQVFTIVAGLHAVLLAFVLISLFDAVSTARAESNREANGLVAISWAAEALPEPAHTKVDQITAAYSDIVVAREWPRMREGEKVDSTAGWQQLDELRATITGTQTADGDDWQASRKETANDQLWEVYQARQARLDAAGSHGVSAVVWFALVFGSVLALTLVYLHGGPKVISQALIVSTLAASITLLLFAIYQLQNPYAGGAAVEPEAFRAVLDRLG
jgi:hypothetical protein